MKDVCFVCKKEIKPTEDRDTVYFNSGSIKICTKCKKRYTDYIEENKAILLSIEHFLEWAEHSRITKG